MHFGGLQRNIAMMTSTLHKCVHCDTISMAYVCQRKMDQRTTYEYDGHTCEGLNRFVHMKCIEQIGELPDRATCAQPNMRQRAKVGTRAVLTILSRLAAVTRREF